jgi:DNA-binding transcriptional MerR regulator
MDPRIPDKQYFRIGEVAAIAAVEPYVLRFWETEFPSLRPGKSRSGQRLYARKDVELVLQVRDLLYEEGFTISGARKALRGGGPDGGEVPPRTRAVLASVRKEVAELLRLTED